MLQDDNDTSCLPALSLSLLLSSSLRLIQNGTRCQPNGCRCCRRRRYSLCGSHDEQASGALRTSSNQELAPPPTSIPASGGGGSLRRGSPPARGRNAGGGGGGGGERHASKVPQPTSTQATRSAAISKRQQHDSRRHRITSSKSSRLVCHRLLLAVVLISLLPFEAAWCKSIETQPEEQQQGVLRSLGDGKTLLNNNKTQQPANTQQAATTTGEQTETEAAATQLEVRSPKPTTLADRFRSFFYRAPTTPIPATTTATATAKLVTETETETETKAEEEKEEGEGEENGTGAGRDDDDAESCEGISADGSAKAANLTDNERLVNLQTCFQRKVRRRLVSATRSGMEMFEKLSLSGGCSSSLMTLMGGLGELKSYAFKFLDASAKIPSGMMYGLLSDYGDFDQCLSIRSNREVAVEEEPDEVGAFSGKYCLMSLKLNYHVKLEQNQTAPEGIVEDGILWDDLVRHYWTSKISKGFQVGMCFPSRCTNDDLNQLYQHVAKSFNVIGEIISCQDNLDLKRQYEPDCLQRLILHVFYALCGLTLVGTLIDRCRQPEDQQQSSSSQLAPTSEESVSSSGGGQNLARTIVQLLCCFSIARNWSRFMGDSYRGCQLQNTTAWRRRRQQQRPANFCWLSDRGPAISVEAKHSNNSMIGVEQSSLTNRQSTSTESSEEVDFIDSDRPDSSSSSASMATTNNTPSHNASATRFNQPLTVRVDSSNHSFDQPKFCSNNNNSGSSHQPLAHLSGLKLLIIIWITVGYSFLYPSANNYQYYRSIIKMNLTRDSVWFAATNFTLGIDMLLYITGLLFVYKLLARDQRQAASFTSRPHGSDGANEDEGVLSLISRRALRFWPTYLTVIGFAIVVPLISDGPMWPEMVSKKISESCRQNWWANLLFINNYLGQSSICLPSSWFISILMQLFLIGSIIVVMVRKISLEAGLLMLATLLASSAGFSFCFAYFFKLRAPLIKMDESFVMDLDENIFRLYTNVFNNLGPFLVGMAGGLLLIHVQKKRSSACSKLHSQASRAAARSEQQWTCQSSKESPAPSRWVRQWTGEVLIGSAAAMIAILVLSSVFHENYSRLTSAIYWSLHRVGWAIVTGYLVHKCATGNWKLLNDLLSLSAFAPLSRLIFIAYLVYPIYIHIHTGLVRDGLHVSIYNMLNIYITRLVMTFATALIIHLLVELPFSTIEENYLRKWINNNNNNSSSSSSKQAADAAGLGPDILDPANRMVHPLLAVAPKCVDSIVADRTDAGGGSAEQTRLQANNSFDKLIPTERSPTG